MDQKPPQSSDTPQTPPSAPSTPSSTPPATPSSDEHKDDHSSDAPATTPDAGSSTPSSEQHSEGTPPAETPPHSDSSSSASTPPPSGAGDHPDDVPHKKHNTVMYAIVTLVIVLIGAGLVTFMAGSNQPQSATNTTAEQPTQPPAPTDVPTVIPSPSNAVEEVESVNVTEDDADLQQAEKDLQSL